MALLPATLDFVSNSRTRASQDFFKFNLASRPHLSDKCEATCAGASTGQHLFLLVWHPYKPSVHSATRILLTVGFLQAVLHWLSIDELPSVIVLNISCCSSSKKPVLFSHSDYASLLLFEFGGCTKIWKTTIETATCQDDPHQTGFWCP